MINQLTRIQKAIALIESGAVTPMGADRWAVSTERMSAQYTVTLTTCNCYDFTETLKGQEPCKHMWAATGASAALLISEIQSAKSISELESVGRKYSEAMKHLHSAFVRIARERYKARYSALSVNAEAGQMLVKPQPQSNGRVNGIEV